MAFFYDSDQERDDLDGLPIILEPGNESTAPQLQLRRPSYEGLRYNLPTYDGASYKGDSDEESDIYQLNSSSYDDKSTVSQLNGSRYGDSNVSQLSKPSYDDMTSHASTDNGDTMKEVQMPVQVPTHPIPSMQDAFAESMLEASGSSTPTVPTSKIGNAAARRKHLLDQDIEEETHASRWRQKPGQKYHELWKLMAQISFGIYLLLNGIAKDEDQVMNILQGHVDEVDEFLESTLEDFDLAQEDIEERVKFLKLPLENIGIFDAMLEDRNFRVQIVSGNERIEHVITRTAKAMNDALKDVSQGLNACKEFTIYLAQEREDALWRRQRPDMLKVFEAMKGNVEGWYKAYVSLQTKGNNLGVALVQLGTIVAEMDRRAGDISRKQRFSATPTQSPASSQSLSPRQSRQMRQSMLKDLPTDPTPITPAIRAALPAFGMVDDRERSPEPEPEPETQSSSPSELEAIPEPDFILKPHTYSPVPSPRPPSPRAAAPSPVIERSPRSPQASSPPEVKQRSSLRKRFSLKRKETPSEITLRPPPARSMTTDDQSRVPSPRHNFAPAPRSASVPNPRETPLNTPPSRGLDSAYCSDFEKQSPPNTTHPALLPTPTSMNSPRVPGRSTPPTLTRDFMPSPRSDQQYFRPVHASPNSPLQRPWTAAPSNIMHMHSNSSSSNLRFGHTPTPSNLGNRRGAPSAMGMSVMTDMTTMTEGSKKVKKKRSAFGWLKKAFSLSEEERAAFEERRRMGERQGWGDDAYGQGQGGRRQREWVDGRRVR